MCSSGGGVHHNQLSEWFSISNLKAVISLTMLNLIKFSAKKYAQFCKRILFFVRLKRNEMEIDIMRIGVQNAF